MSKNLSQTLFYEFYKSDPNFIYESVEEYRNYKSDPDFADKTLEEYRRVKALLKKEEETSIHPLQAGEYRYTTQHKFRKRAFFLNENKKTKRK